MKAIEKSYIIRFPDCDPFNHLNNSRYLDYFMNAREDHLLEHYGFNIYGYAKETGKSWVVSRTQIAYQAPALLGETVVINSQILAWNPSDILVEMQMWNKEKTVLKSLLWSKFVHFDLLKQRRIEHEENLGKIFLKDVVPSNGPLDFDSRLKELRSIMATTV